MGELKMAGLTELTMESYQELKKTGKVEQVSGPLTTWIYFGETLGNIAKRIKIKFPDYADANSYMAGPSRQTLDGSVTPLVLYKVSE